MASADEDDLADVMEKAVDVTTDMLTGVTPISGPPSPDDITAPIIDGIKEAAIKPIWEKPFDRVRPTTSRGRSRGRECIGDSDISQGGIKRLGE